MNVRATSNQEKGLRAVRLALGITQAELAERTGIHRSLVSRIERGLVPSWPRFRKAAAAALGLPEDSIFPTMIAPGKPKAAHGTVGDPGALSSEEAS